MRTQIKLYGLLITILAVTAGSCRKAEDLTAQVAAMEFVGDHLKLNGPIDEWLYQNVTVPYNIRVQWRWDRSETDLDRNVTPIMEEKVIPIADMLLQYFLEPYAAEAGDYFIKRYPPKLYMLLGSASYNTNGTKRLGSADQGRKVALYELNEVEFGEYNSGMERVLKTVHHEFGHILDQNRRVGPEFGLLSEQSHYVEELWNSTYNDGITHLNRGFITPYAGSQPSEDFVEVVATLLAYGQHWFNNEVMQASPAGQEILRQKEGIVVDYFKASWGIDFRSLQQRIADLRPAPPVPALIDFLGEEKSYTYAQLNYNNIPTESAAIWQSFNTESVSEANREISYLRWTPLEDGKMLIRVTRFAAGAGTTGSASFARIYFDMIENNDGTISFTFSQDGTDPFTGNTAGTQAALRGNSDNLIAFMEGHRFVWDWGDDDMQTGGLWVVDDDGEKTGVALIGVLGNY